MEWEKNVKTAVCRSKYIWRTRQRILPLYNTNRDINVKIFFEIKTCTLDYVNNKPIRTNYGKIGLWDVCGTPFLYIQIQGMLYMYPNLCNRNIFSHFASFDIE